MQVRSSLNTTSLQGIHAIPVFVEVLISSGLPHFSIVGMPDAAIQEARERIRAAIRSCGFSMPDGKVIVNLAPSSIKKMGTGFDLPIALSILAATQQISSKILKNSLFVGELSLEGRVKPVKGMLAYEVCAREQGWNLLCAQPQDGLLHLDGIELQIVKHLQDFRTGSFYEPSFEKRPRYEHTLDYRDISGNEIAKRALQIAVAGEHGVLMMGPPGSGKTMLAERLPSIMPPLSEKEILETALIYSVTDENSRNIIEGIRPFRNPHHSATLPGLIGGGTPPRPGEISLAHNGVLFLDELPEFKPSTLQSIRQPIESGYVSITRADGKVRFPTRFMLVAAANPCPCGYYGDPEIECNCSFSQINTYQNRIGGPLFDRISMHINVWRSKPEDILRSGSGISSQELQDGVRRAREFRSYRLRDHDPNKTLSPHTIVSLSRLKESDRTYLEELAELHSLSGRGIIKVLSIARTIADIAQKDAVQREHLHEALELRLRHS